MKNDNKRTKPDAAKAIKYRGPLSPSQAAAGVNVAIRNSRRLMRDARLLFEAGSYPTAAAIAILAIEESGKSGIIQRILLAKSERQRKEHWSEFTNHRAKNTAWIIPNMIASGARTLDDFRGVWKNGALHAYQLEDFKLWALYTDCRNRGYWSEPEHDITQEVAAEILTSAEKSIRTLLEVSE
jgi:AbiV family abortive infection protein